MSGPRTSLAVAALTMAVENGTVMAFSVLYLPLVAEFGEGRGMVAMVQSGVVLLGGLGAPLAGAALDRWGPRRLFQGGAALAALGLLWASQVQSLPWLVLAYGVVAGAGLSFLASQPNMVVVAQWFPRRRAQAIALADLGTPAGVFLLVPLTQLLVDRLGWRTSLQILAALLVVLVIPANALQRQPPAAAPAVGAGARSLRTALRTPTFWWLALLRFFAGLGFTLVNTHAVAAAVGAGIPPLQAAAALGSVSVVSLGGRLGVGWLADRLGPAPALTVSYSSGLAGIGCLGALVATGRWEWLAAFVGFYGLAQGSSGIVATAAATAAFHGQAVGVITGWIAVASGPGEALGAWGGGALYDWTGGYRAALGLSAAALVTGVAAIWQVRARAWTP
ncbi:MAG TPA: MFS transporter [Methylomirabilota bacterium]|jgi:MFS family permease|nr:MFS transporter [Methylomirabilota bacterium]